jgi:hypothetical protein
MSPTPTPEPQPLTPEELAVICDLYRTNKYDFNDGSADDKILTRLLATIDKLQAEKAESDARLAAVLRLCGQHDNCDERCNGARRLADAIRKAISGGKQNG